MQKKTNFFVLLCMVALFVLVMLFAHRPGYVETDQDVLVDFAAFVPEDGVVELMDSRAGLPEKQFPGQDAVDIILSIQNAGITPYSGPKHTPAPDIWRASCKDSQGNLVFSLSLDRQEICYSHPAEGIETMFYSISQEDMDALHAKLEQFFNTQ